MCYHSKQTKEIVFSGMKRKNYKTGQSKTTISKNRKTNKAATKQQQNSI